ncbi:unnamed protein product [Strongylus vulgaris]|uniref:TauD/TfdA-like domain-containing protein n=1 Tax=Strongylus vulgaris TaxID=40348 RepID=A0A3P7J8K1_STRVU|nr:unnamed protein product [Strongylus vulgaris]
MNYLVLILSHFYAQNNSLLNDRFNPYDRAPFRVLKEGEDSIGYARAALTYYQSYTEFSSICHAGENSTTISLRPGTVIFLDNHRVLHSRTSFKVCFK